MDLASVNEELAEIDGQIGDILRALHILVCQHQDLMSRVLLNLLYYYGTRVLVKESLPQRYFSMDVRGNGQDPESEIVQACRSLLDERQGTNVWRFLQAINRRHDLTESLKKLQCRTLIFVGENSQFHANAVHMTTKLDRRYCALVEVQACGSLVTEEQPHAMVIPMEYLLMCVGACVSIFLSCDCLFS